jgi:hypothetical protein
MKTKNKQVQTGLTLIELVLSLFIFGIIGGTATVMLRNGFELTTASNDAQEMASVQRYVNERIAKEIRAVSYDTLTSSYNITLMTSTQLRFTKFDSNQVTITLGASDITLGYSVPAVSSTLTDKVTAGNFTYYQADGVTLATSNVDIRFIELTLTLTRDTTAYNSKIRIALRDL